MNLPVQVSRPPVSVAVRPELHHEVAHPKTCFRSSGSRDTASCTPRAPNAARPTPHAPRVARRVHTCLSRRTAQVGFGAVSLGRARVLDLLRVHLADWGDNVQEYARLRTRRRRRVELCIPGDPSGFKLAVSRCNLLT